MTKHQTNGGPKARTFPKPDPRDTIEVSWHIDDVLEVRKGLSREQRRKVLEAVERNHDANFGIDWYVIETTADELYPRPDSGD